MVLRTSGKQFYTQQHIGPVVSLAAIVPCITASSPSEAVVGQHNVHGRLCSSHRGSQNHSNRSDLFCTMSSHGEVSSSSP